MVNKLHQKIYNKSMQVAEKLSKEHPKVKKINTVESFSGFSINIDLFLPETHLIYRFYSGLRQTILLVKGDPLGSKGLTVQTTCRVHVLTDFTSCHLSVSCVHTNHHKL